MDAIMRACKGTKQWTNGIENIRLPGDQEAPDGFWRGLTRKNMKNKGISRPFILNQC